MFSIKRCLVAAIIGYLAHISHGNPVAQLEAEMTTTPSSPLFAIQPAGGNRTAGQDMSLAEVSVLGCNDGGDCCAQGDCPDYEASFDMLGTPNHWWIRANHRVPGCNQVCAYGSV